MQICLGTLNATPQFIPLALLYLKAYLVDHEGMAAGDVAVVEFAKADTPESIASQILATNPDILALSCYVWNITTFRAVCSLLKAARPGLVIVLGGPEVGPLGDAVLSANPAVDIVVKSEGEVAFAAIVAALRQGQALDHIKGLWFRQGTRLADTGEAPILMDLNLLPSPHQPALATGERRIVCVETQRGCVFRCNFCFYNKDLSIRNRRFDLDRVKQEILFWLDRDVVELYLMDPIFNLKAERAKEICRFIAVHNHRRVPFHAEVWAEFMDDELARLMREANVTFVEVGLQTADADALAAVDRRLRLPQFIDGIGHLKRHAIPFELQLIHGLPGETPASFKRALDFAASLDPPHLAVFPLMVLPGTELHRKAGAMGLAYDAEPPYFVRSHQTMNADEICAGREIAEGVRTLGDSRTVRLLCRDAGIGMSEMIDDWLAWRRSQPGAAAMAPSLRAFVADFCATRRVPAGFYTSFASKEFAD